MRISIVIPTFNNWSLTRRCLDAIRRSTPPALIAEIIVVDDASTDGISPAWTAAQSYVTPVLLERNRGFSGACNAGAARATGDIILFLNNDAFARAGALGALRDTLAGDARIGVVGARLLYSDGSLQHAGLALLPGAVSRWWHIHKRRDGGLSDANIARDFLAVTGAALAIRRDLFRAIGGFDEGFANGWEDVDLCLRVWCAGARVRYEPRAVFEHLESATLGHHHNHERNERRFSERWESILHDAPRYPLAEVPPVAFAVAAHSQHQAGDEWALTHIERWWKAHVGAAVLRTRPASRIDRARIDVLAAVARRRPTLEISWGDAALAPATGAQRIAFVAPQTPASARAYARARDVTAWWAPTDGAYAALIEAGAPPDRVTLVRLGAETRVPPVRNGAPVVAGCESDANILAALARELPAIRTVVLPNTARPALDDVDIVVAGSGDDRWGLLLPSAIGQGCTVVAVPPLDALTAAAAGVIVVEGRHVLDALRHQVAAISAVRAKSSDIYLEARRRFDAYLATQHVSELARATTGGTPPASLIEVDAAYARRLHGTRIELAVSVG